MDLGDWLRSLGLEQYGAAFRENAIDDRVLLGRTSTPEEIAFLAQPGSSF
jgi:SAM domain (Sterile alpha motif)